MAKYEYVLVGRDQAEKLDHITEIVNYHGSQGYRLTLVSDWFFCFEREVQEVPVVNKTKKNV